MQFCIKSCAHPHPFAVRNAVGTMETFPRQKANVNSHGKAFAAVGQYGRVCLQAAAAPAFAVVEAPQAFLLVSNAELLREESAFPAGDSGRKRIQKRPGPCSSEESCSDLDCGKRQSPSRRRGKPPLPAFPRSPVPPPARSGAPRAAAGLLT